MDFAYYGSRESSKELVYELLLNNPPRLIAVDTEAISLKIPEAVGLGIAVSPTDSFYFPVLPEESVLLPEVLQILRRPDICKVFHNSFWDLEVLAHYDIDKSNIADTVIMARLAGARDAKLTTLAVIAGISLPDIPPIKETTFEWSQEQIVTKCCSDAEAAYQLYQKYSQQIDMNYLKTEMKLVPILLTMSAKGLQIDQELRAEIELELESELHMYESIAEDLGFNPSSPKQVAYMLAKDRVFLPFTKGRKSLRTDELTLRKLSHPIAAMTLAYREQKTLYSRYISPLAACERLYTKYHLDSITGRVSSGGSKVSFDTLIFRNIQNIPKGRMRNIFLPDTGLFTDADFSQIELRTLAFISQDDTMQAVFDAEGDIHQATADLMGTSRLLAKSCNFALIYGGTDETLMEIANISSRTKARELRILWAVAYPKANRWIERQQQTAPKAGFITTLYGRRIPLPLEMEESPDRIKRKAVNYPIQSSAAEVVKRAMIRCDEEGLTSRMRLQVHDELLFEGNVVRELEDLDLQHIGPFETPYNVRLLEKWE